MERRRKASIPREPRETIDDILDCTSRCRQCGALVQETKAGRNACASSLCVERNEGVAEVCVALTARCVGS